MSDLIRREDAIKALYKYSFVSKDIIEREINAIPSADRPRGEWIRDKYWSRGAGMGEEYGFFYKCSLCGYEVENGYTRCDFNFCPSCGARMKGRINK